MPISKTKQRKQQKLFGIALGMKRGKVPKSYSSKASKIASSMDVNEIKKMIGEIGKKRKK